MKVLLVGDSHTAGSYGENLMALLRGSASVMRLAAVGASAGDFLSGGKYYSDSVSSFKAPHDLAIITLGTNDAVGVDGPVSASNAAQRIKKLADSINAKTVLWVGPPSFSTNAAANYNPVFQKMDLNMRADYLWQSASTLLRSYDSRPATKAYVVPNDIHFGPNGGKEWARAVALGPVADILASAPTDPVDPPVVRDDGDGSPPPEKTKSNVFLYVGIAAILLGLLLSRRK